MLGEINWTNAVSSGVDVGFSDELTSGLATSSGNSHKWTMQSFTSSHDLVHISESNHIIAMTGLSPVTGGLIFNGHIQDNRPWGENGLMLCVTDQKSVKFKVAAVICWKIWLLLHYQKCFWDAFQSFEVVEDPQFLWSINHFRGDGWDFFFQLLIVQSFEAYVQLPEESCFVSDNYRIHSAGKESSEAFEPGGEIMPRMFGQPLNRLHMEAKSDFPRVYLRLHSNSRIKPPVTYQSHKQTFVLP